MSVFLGHRADGCSPVFLAYGHHPLSTILHPDVPFWRQIDRTSPLTIYGKLSQHGVQAHVNGHLHSVFGQRLHMMHKSFAQGMLQDRDLSCVCILQGPSVHSKSLDLKTSLGDIPLEATQRLRVVC